MLNYCCELGIAFWKLDVTSVVLIAIIAVMCTNKYKVLDKALIEFPVTDAVSYCTARANACMQSTYRVVQHYDKTTAIMYI